MKQKLLKIFETLYAKIWLTTRFYFVSYSWHNPGVGGGVGSVYMRYKGVPRHQRRLTQDQLVKTQEFLNKETDIAGVIILNAIRIEPHESQEK